jgi:hypothetical protein
LRHRGHNQRANHILNGIANLPRASLNSTARSTSNSHEGGDWEVPKPRIPNEARELYPSIIILKKVSDLTNNLETFTIALPTV